MKKILLGVIGLAAVGMSAPASAADLAARPYTKAPPPMVAAIYDWTGFYLGFNGGGGSIGSDDSGGDFGTSGPSSAPRRAVAAGGRNSDMDDDIPF